MHLYPLYAAETPQEVLKQYVEELQKNPDDNVLREKIIKHVQTIKPAPAIPEEAERAFVKGVTFMEEAKGSAGFDLAISSFRQALMIAPWWPEAYYNLSIAHQSAEKHDEAVLSLKLYLLTLPSEPDAAKARRLIYAIEAKKELKQKEIAEAREKRKSEIDFGGIWDQDQTCWRYKFAVNGNEIVITKFCPNLGEELVGWATLNGRIFEGRMNTSPNERGGSACPGNIKGVIREDNRGIRISFPSCRGGTYEHNLIRK